MPLSMPLPIGTRRTKNPRFNQPTGRIHYHARRFWVILDRLSILLLLPPLVVNLYLWSADRRSPFSNYISSSNDASVDGFGILDRQKNDFGSRQFVDREDGAETVYLALDGNPGSKTFVIENGNHFGSSEVQIVEMRFVLEPSAKIKYSGVSEKEE